MRVKSPRKGALFLSTVGEGSHPPPRIGATEFVCMMSAFMALHAFAMDSMLPALPDISKYLSMPHENDLQSIVTVYLIGFGSTQVVYGLFSDRYGRRNLILLALILYISSSIFALISQSQVEFLMARLLQGASCAGTVVISLSIIRDVYSGRAMSRIMSLVMMVFMMFPVLAPSFGLSIITVFNWRGIFIFLVCLGVGVLLWSAVRLPETLPRCRRIPLNFSASSKTIRQILGNRMFLGYMIAQTFALAVLFTFLTMSGQIFVGVYKVGNSYPIILAVIALASSFTSLVNSLLVVSIGMRRLSHGSIIFFTICSGILLYLSLGGMVDFWPFVTLCALIMASFGFMGANFNAIALEPLGHMAGTASSVIGTLSTLGGTLLGLIVGQFFNNTILPLSVGLTVFGFGALFAALYAENGALLKEKTKSNGL
ncbi:multidrug effflux MFS transporter [Flexibacterium corallicola]|uniref:multidrug effflux MFS transporter n=1 Tax=Flexibacterium corallicola TaxID=3037259 RepID=UPI00286F5077|nr:multidrug effflux MFS transporter [Pseudovibrio sp. M1P-2-3]